MAERRDGPSWLRDDDDDDDDGYTAIPNIVRSTIGLLSDSYALKKTSPTAVLDGFISERHGGHLDRTTNERRLSYSKPCFCCAWRIRSALNF